MVIPYPLFFMDQTVDQLFNKKYKISSLLTNENNY